jgi:hypothetical protein
MEIFLWAILAVTFALLVYAIVSTSADIRRKGQPAIDSFFDALHSFLRIGNSKPDGNRRSKQG